MTTYEHDNVFERWEIRFPEFAEEDPDPGVPMSCRGADCHSFAWRGYDGLCGWCKWEEDFGDVLSASG